MVVITVKILLSNMVSFSERSLGFEKSQFFLSVKNRMEHQSRPVSTVHHQPTGASRSYSRWCRWPHVYENIWDDLWGISDGMAKQVFVEVFWNQVFELDQTTIKELGRKLITYDNINIWRSSKLSIPQAASSCGVKRGGQQAFESGWVRFGSTLVY